MSIFKNIFPIVLSVAAGAWLIVFGYHQFAGGARLFFEEDTLPRLAAVPIALPATPALRDEAIVVWGRAAPKLNDTTTWTQYGDILVSSANANNPDVPLRDKRLAAAAAAYRTALELSPSNGRAWTMLAAVRLRLGATPEEASTLLRMSLRAASHDAPLVLPRLDTAFYIWRVLPVDLRAAMGGQVRIATESDLWAFVRLVHQHYMLEPVRDLLAYDRNLQWTFDREYMATYP